MCSLLSTAATLLFMSLAAHGDTILIYDVNATYTNHGTVTGTLMLDSTSGTIMAINLTAAGFPLGSGPGYSRFFQLGTGINVQNGRLGTEVKFLSLTHINAGYAATTIPVTSSTFISGNNIDIYQSTSVTIIEKTSGPAPVSTTPVP